MADKDRLQISGFDGTGMLGGTDIDNGNIIIDSKNCSIDGVLDTLKEIRGGIENPVPIDMVGGADYELDSLTIKGIFARFDKLFYDNDELNYIDPDDPDNTGVTVSEKVRKWMDDLFYGEN